MQIGADSLSANIDTAAVTRAACEGQISALVLRPFPPEPTRHVIQETGNMMVKTCSSHYSAIKLPFMSPFLTVQTTAQRL